MKYTKLSLDYMKTTSLAHRKSLGQYFTPKNICESILKEIPKKENMLILDPSSGGGDFLIAAGKYFDKCVLHGFEIDASLAKLSRKNIENEINSNTDLKIECVDTLKKNPKPIYDLVVGNPPYFEMKLNKENKKLYKEKYKDVVHGRINIFSLFIMEGINYLKDGGYLAYIVPSSMNNGAYFKKLRDYIIKNTSIEYLKILKNDNYFVDAKQAVMMIILKKGSSGKKYIFEKNGITIFSEKYEEIKNYYKNKTTLFEIEATVKTGSVVWNEHKNELTKDSKNAVLLIRSKNIKDGKLLDFNNKENKKLFDYIKIEKTDPTPAIAVNRITGSSNNMQVKAALIKNDFKYVGENHINIIFYKKGKDNKLFPLEKIYSSLTNKKNIEIMKLIIGNTQISKNELEKLFPIDF